MDKNQRQQFWRMVLTEYTVGSLACMLITYVLNITTLPYIRALHICLFFESVSAAYIWIKLYRKGMSKKEFWKLRSLNIAVMMAEYIAFQVIYRLIHQGMPKALHVLPQILLTGCGMIIVGMILSSIITDRIEKAYLKRINEKLSRNRPQ